MARRLQAEAFAQVAAVRAVQREQAISTHAQASLQLRLLREREAEAAAVLEKEQHRWTALLAGPSLDLTLAGLFARTILSRRGELLRTTADAEAGAEALASCAQALSRASAEADVADAVARAAARRERRALEEAALAVCEDRSATRAER